MASRQEQKTLASSALYSVGWIAALPLERAAATLMLDETHSKPKDFVKNRADDNIYSWGCIAEHNVVIASLPAGEYGTVSAATTVSGLRSSLPHIRIGVLVGIGAGIPGTGDVLLGDVVVSNPDRGNGGLVQYDLYKASSTTDERKGFLNSPPRSLRNALAVLQADHEVNDSKIEEFLKVFQGSRKAKLTYSYPGSQKDPLRQTSPPTSEPRDWPKIHYGTVASGNILIKDAEERDSIIKWLAKENIKPICFEMEAAGLMNTFPCLVIRGICDYADQRKDDVWQRYAAATAAAFAKESLGYVDGGEIEETAKIGDLKELVADIKEVKEVKEDLSTDKWLAAPNISTNYNKALKQRHPGTGIWFLESTAFTQWKESPRSFLWLHGIPGCGKTVLSTSVIEHLEQPSNSHKINGTTVIYFYFDFNDTTKQTIDNMARSLISQCSCHSKDAQLQLDQLFGRYESGKKQPSTESLIATLSTMFQSSSQLRIVLDALDECTTRKELLQWIRGLVAPRAKDLQLLATSRKEQDIESGITAWAQTDESLSIQGSPVNDDIRSYVKARIDDLDSELNRWRSRPDVQSEISTKLMEKAQGMFRWAACQLDVLEECLDLPDLREALATLPKTLHKTYDRILESIPDRHKKHAIRILQFLTYSERPLQFEEAVDAIAVSPTLHARFNPQDRMPNAREIARVCSSPVTVIQGDFREDKLQKGEQLQLAHFSVKEYLVSGQVNIAFEGQLRECATRSVIANVSLVYLLSLDHSLLAQQLLTDFPLSAYSAKYWISNVLASKSKDNVTQELVLKLFTDRLGAYSSWLSIYDPNKFWTDEPRKMKSLPPPLYYASLGGLFYTACSLLEQGADVNAHGGFYGNALQAASSRGHEAVVRLLLTKGANWIGRAPRAAYEKGHGSIVELLLASSQALDLGRYALLPIHLSAIANSCVGIQLALNHGVRVDLPDGQLWTPLHWSAYFGCTEVARFLLENGADTTLGDWQGWTPYHVATFSGHNTATKDVFLRSLEHSSDETSCALRETLQGLCDCCGHVLLSFQYHCTICPAPPGYNLCFRCIRDAQALYPEHVFETSFRYGT